MLRQTGKLVFPQVKTWPGAYPEICFGDIKVFGDIKLLNSRSDVILTP